MNHRLERTLRLPLVLVLALALAGCGGDPASGRAITQWRGTPLTAEQLPFAADGVVTEAELRVAFEAAARCVEDEGWTATLNEAPYGGYQLGTGGAAGETADTSVLESCVNRFVGGLEPIFQSGRVSTGEERERQFGEWQTCMTVAGASVEGASLGDSMETMISGLQEANGPYADWDPSWQACIQEYYFVLWPETLG